MNKFTNYMLGVVTAVNFAAPVFAQAQNQKPSLPGDVTVTCRGGEPLLMQILLNRRQVQAGGLSNDQPSMAEVITVMDVFQPGAENTLEQQVSGVPRAQPASSDEVTYARKSPDDVTVEKFLRTDNTIKRTFSKPELTSSGQAALNTFKLIADKTCTQATKSVIHRELTPAEENSARTLIRGIPIH